MTIFLATIQILVDTDAIPEEELIIALDKTGIRGWKYDPDSPNRGFLMPYAGNPETFYEEIKPAATKTTDARSALAALREIARLHYEGDILDDSTLYALDVDGTFIALEEVILIARHYLEAPQESANAQAQS